jgi:hypothetical protein
MSQAERQLSQEIFGRQKPLDPVTFDSGWIDHQQCRGPLRVIALAEAFEVIGLIFHVDPGRDEVLLDKSGYAFVRIYLGIQPGTSASHGSGAEIEQQMAILGPRLFQSLIDVFPPGDVH